jgi:hypothetical protein
MFALSILAVVAVIVFGGKEFLYKSWWILLAAAAYLTAFSIIVIKRCSLGHTTKCALRYGALKVF